MIVRRLTSLLIVILLHGCSMGISPTTLYQPRAFVPSDTAGPGPDTAKYGDIGPRELQAAIMSFADTSNSRTVEAAHIIEKIGTPKARLTAARVRVFNTTSAVEIAAGPYPGIALLDMIVVTTLNRMIWEEYWVPKFGEQARPAMKYFEDAEEDIWEIAAKIMTEQQRNDLQNIIRLWRTKNPNQISVSFIRFHDFGELGLKPSMRQLTVPGGLFSSVKEAALVAQDMKIAIDRAFFLMSRMQLVANFQFKLAYLEMLFEPETQAIADETEHVTGLAERYAEIAEKLPEQIRGESSKLMDQLFTQLSRSRDETLSGVLAGLTQWQSDAITQIMTNIAAEREATIKQAIDALILQQDELYSRVDKLVDRSTHEVENSMNHAFMLTALLIVLFFVLLALYKILVARPIDRRQG